ncbi:MAG: ABC transporter ATP-binding protein [Actinobacteria bacterium]|nr:MAG: ABC transporter ATP-binding protein [Actinomycetota bacterium]
MSRHSARAERSATRTTTRTRLDLLIGDRRRMIVALAGFSLLAGFSEAATLALIAQLAYGVVKGGSHLHTNIGPFSIHASIGTLLEIAFGVCIIRILLVVPVSVLPARIATSVQAGLRTRIFDAYTRSSWRVQSTDREGQLQETMTNQVMQATMAALMMTSLITTGIMFVVLTLSAFALNVLAAVVVLAVSFSGFAILAPMRRRLRSRAGEMSEAQVNYAGGIAEAVSVAQEIHVFGADAAQRTRIDGFVQRTREITYRTQLLMRLAPALYQAMIYLLLIGGLAALEAIGRGHAGALGGVVLLMVRAGSTGQSVQTAYQGLVQALPFIERTQNAEQRYRADAPRAGGLPLPRIKALAFERVSFAYREGVPALQDISFAVAGNETIGIVGPSGAGKSTLVQLLLRLREPQDGHYLVNGTPAEEFARRDWQARVSYVPQEPRLIHASVADNIRFFRDLDAQAIERGARLARIHDVVMSWRDGYETIVGPRAAAVSGGQQQRICLARALAGSPEVLILDEPTSALDPQSEKAISASLTSLSHELTLFIVAHRMSTLDMCDRVMVIIDGRLVAFDTKALLERENSYYRVASELAGTSGAGAA